MAQTAKLEVTDQNPLAAVRGFLKTLLTRGDLTALMVARHLPMKTGVMPTLVTQPEHLASADPLAPAFPLNAARMVSRLTRRPLDGQQVAVVLRPCEMRAFIELVKLKQGHLDDVLLVGIDCLGAFANVDYPRFANNDGEEATLRFVKAMLTDGHPATSGVDLSLACRACEYFVPDNADLLVGLVGVDPSRELLIQANTAKGEAIFANLGLAPGEEPEGRKAALADLTARRIAQRDRMFQETSEATADLAKLNAFLANCVNCYNCRVACPVCYCKECVFLTNVFEYEPSQYLRWAKRKGLIKMPTDTVFFHLTRLMHMSTACVGCGQCSNACPNNVPVMELFRTIAHYTQRAFNYTAGRSLEDEPPLSVFREGEFPEVTGGK